MPIIVKSNSKNNNNNKVIREFKKVTAMTDIVQRVRDRRYFKRPSLVNAATKIQKKRLQKRIRSLKKTKNIGDDVIERMTKRLNS